MKGGSKEGRRGEREGKGVMKRATNSSVTAHAPAAGIGITHRHSRQAFLAGLLGPLCLAGRPGPSPPSPCPRARPGGSHEGYPRPQNRNRNALIGNARGSGSKSSTCCWRSGASVSRRLARSSSPSLAAGTRGWHSRPGALVRGHECCLALSRGLDCACPAAPLDGLRRLIVLISVCC